VALKAGSAPEGLLLRAEEVDFFALSAVVDAEIAEVSLARSSLRRYRCYDARAFRNLGVWRCGLSLPCASPAAPRGADPGTNRQASPLNVWLYKYTYMCL
jgi:hypothetical protein